MADLMDVFVKIGADTSGLESGIGKAEGAVSSFASGVGKVAKLGVGAFAAVGTAVVGSSAAFVSAAGDIAEYGDNIDKMSQKMGISAQGYQEWEAVMQHSGTSMETMKSSMKTLANAVEKGNDSFERIGISIEDLGNMSNEEIFNATIAGLQNVENETERTYLAGQLLGKGATELGALLNTSAEDTQAMKDRVHELGGVMSDDAVKAAAAYQDSLQDMQTAFGGLKRNLVSQFLPSITKVMDGLTNLFSGDSKGLGQIKEGISSFVDNLTEAIPQVLRTGAEIIESIATAIMENAPQLIAAGVDTIVMLAEGLVQNSGIIIDAVFDLMNMALNGIEDFDFATAAQNIIDYITNAFSGNGIGKLLLLGYKIMTSLVNGMLEAIPVLVSNLSSIMGGIADGIATGLPKLVEMGTKVLLDFVNVLTTNLSPMIDVGINMIMALADGLLNALPTLIQAVPQIITQILTALITNAPKLIAAGVELIVKLTVGIVQMIPTLIAEFPKMLQQVVQSFNSVDWSGLGSKIITTIVNGVKALYNALPDIIKSIATAMVNIVTNTDWVGVGINVIEFILSGIKTLVTAIPDLLKTIAENAVKVVKDIDWLQLGKDIIQGVINGLEAAKDWLIDKFRGIFGAAKDQSRKEIEASSPSRWFRREIGRNITLGIGLGIEDEKPKVAEAMEGLTEMMEEPDMSANISMVGDASSIGGSSYEDRGELIINDMADAFVKALERYGLMVEIDRRELGRVVRKEVFA